MVSISNTSKIYKALNVMHDQIGDESLESDSSGSAKVALIAIDRCLLAWQNIMQFLRNDNDAILPTLALLQKIKDIGEFCFPNARPFVREGFDD